MKVEFSSNIGAAMLLETIKCKLRLLLRWLILPSHYPINGICFPLLVANLLLNGFKSVLSLNLL